MRIRSLASAAATAGAVVALAAVAAAAQGPEMKMEAPTKAIAVLIPTKTGGKVAGTITFTKAAKGTRVQADLTGLPAGKHGFHIHEFGDASSPDGKAAGSHFDPKMAKKHGDPSKTDVRHLGDLGNISADDSGKATYDQVYPDLPIEPDPRPRRRRPREGRRLRPARRQRRRPPRRRRHRRRQGELSRARLQEAIRNRKWPMIDGLRQIRRLVCVGGAGNSRSSFLTPRPSLIGHDPLPFPDPGRVGETHREGPTPVGFTHPIRRP